MRGEGEKMREKGKNKPNRWIFELKKEMWRIGGWGGQSRQREEEEQLVLPAACLVRHSRRWTNTDR